MVSSPMRQIAFVGALLAVAGLLSMAAAGSATSASQPAQRQVAATTLSDFKVVLTATREPGHPPLATVTAAGYRRSGGHWQPIATRRIGKASGWFWFSVQTCSLTTTQLKDNMVSTSPPVVMSDSIKVSLLVTPPSAAPAPTARPTSALKYGPIHSFGSSIMPSSEMDRPATIFLMAVSSG